MILKIFSIFTLLVLATTQCQPLYWEVDPTYNITSNELVNVANIGIIVNDITHKSGTKNYNISVIHGNITYDRSQQTISRQGNTINVNGSIFNVLFNFSASVAKYSGNGTAKIDGITISYTKNPAINNGIATFNFSNVKVNVPTVVPISYQPEPTTAQKSQFNSLLTTDLTQKVKQYFNNDLNQLLSDAAAKNGFPYNFDTRSYKYSYSVLNNSQSVTIDTSVISMEVFDQGYIFGYNGSINSHSYCSQYRPTDNTKKSSFFPTQFIKALYEQYANNFSAWQNMTIDQSNAQSTYFGFRIADLDNILDDLTIAFPNVLDKIQAQCIIDKDQDSDFDLRQTQKQIRLKAGWTCGLYTVKNPTLLLQFHVVNQYRLSINQNGTQLYIKFIDVFPKTTKWTKVQFDIISQSLADMYLIDVVSKFNNQLTLGTKFQQPIRVSPQVVVWPEAIQIYEDNVTEIII